MEENEEGNPKLLLVGKIGVLIGVFLSLSFLFVRADVVGFLGAGRSEMNLWFYYALILPLSLVCFIGFLTNRFFIVSLAYLAGLFIIIYRLYTVYIYSDTVVISYGYYLIVFGLLLILFFSSLIAHIHKREIDLKRGIFFIFFNIFILSLIFLLARFTVDVSLSAMGSLPFCFLLFLFPFSLSTSSLLYGDSAEMLSAIEKNTDIILNLFVWGVSLFIFSYIFLTAGACSCSGCYTSLPIGILSLSFLFLWISLSFLLPLSAKHLKNL